MKIGIVSDLHLGYERFFDDAYTQARDALEKASELADVLIIPGDIFDYRRPEPEVMAQAVELFRDISRKQFEAKVIEYTGKNLYTNKPIIAIPGTHERRSEGAVDSVDVLHLAGLLVSVNKSKVVVEKSGERIAVFGIGGVADERFRETIKDAGFIPDANAFNIFMIHQTLYELLPFSKEFTHIEELPEGFDLYVDGHIHSRVEMKCHGKDFLIPGSTVLTQLKGLEQEEKGFFIYDTKTYTYTFHKITSRPFSLIKIDIEDKDPKTITDSIQKAIESTIINNTTKQKPIIKIEMTGKIKKGFKPIDINLGAISIERNDAIIEITKNNVEEVKASEEAEEIRARRMENMSIKDYGISIFLEKLSNNKYSLSLSPSKLFDILSSDERKETAVNNAMKELFMDNN